MVLASAVAVSAQREKQRKENERHGHGQVSRKKSDAQRDLQRKPSRLSLENDHGSPANADDLPPIKDALPDNFTLLQRKGRSLPYQKLVHDNYERNSIKVFVALLIAANFVVSAVEAQMLPVKGSSAARIFGVIEVFFNTVFVIELLGNMYGNFFLAFWRSSWNIFDFIIVVISITSMIATNLPGITVLRLFRAFRVFRLFKRIRCLQQIMIGISHSIPGVRDAMVVLGMITAIWAIIGVNFFGDKAEYKDFYGNFGKAMLTHLQIMTLDSWASQIARPIIFKEGAQYIIFFVSYILINGVIMMNIVVAILLDSFITAIKSIPDGDENESEMCPDTWTWDSGEEEIFLELDEMTSKTKRLVNLLSADGHKSLINLRRAQLHN